MVSELLLRPEFWASHYYETLQDEDERHPSELVEECFGFSADDLYSFESRELIHPEGDGQPPRVVLPLFDGFSTQVDYVDCGEDGWAVRYFVHHHGWQESELLGYRSPHHALPAFRWVEIDLLARAVGLATGDTVASAAALLLLFPAASLTEEDDEEYAAGRLEAAWLALPSLGIQNPAQLARYSVLETFNELRSWRDAELGWISDGRYSFRNPKTLMCEFSARRFERVKQLLTSVADRIDQS